MKAEQHLEEMRDIAERAADRALQKFFLQLGVDASEAGAVLAMQKDFAHLRAWRESIDMVKRRGLAASVTVIVTGILGAVYTLWKHV